jgi:hypothetical protein
MKKLTFYYIFNCYHNHNQKRFKYLAKSDLWDLKQYITVKKINKFRSVFQINKKYNFIYFHLKCTNITDFN